MKSFGQLWDLESKHTLSLEEYIAKTKSTPMTVVKAYDKAEYALYEYKTMLAKLETTRCQNLAKSIQIKMDYSLEVQQCIKDEQNSIVEGITEVKKACSEALGSIGDNAKSSINYHSDSIDSYIKQLAAQKSKIEADILALEKAKSSNKFKPVESLLVGPPESFKQFCFDVPPKDSFSYTWNGTPLKHEEIIQKADRLFQIAFYTPYKNILGKRKRSEPSKLLKVEDKAKQKKHKKNISEGVVNRPMPQKEEMPSKPNEEKINKEEYITVKKINPEVKKTENLESNKKVMPNFPPLPEQMPSLMTSQNFIDAKGAQLSKAANPVINAQEQPAVAPVLEQENAPKQQETNISKQKKVEEAKKEMPKLLKPVFMNTKNLSQLDQCCYFLKPSTEELFVYDIASRIFKKHKRYSTSKKIPLNFAMCVHHGQVYISGGDKEGSSCQIANAFIINISGTNFNLDEISSMQKPKRQHTMISAGRYIFSIGGFDSSLGKHLKTCERFDGNNWEYMPEINKERRGITGVYHSQHIYAINGNCDASILLFERMDINTCIIWEELKVVSGTFTHRFLTAGISINDTSIILFGGYDKEVKSDAYILDTDHMEIIRINDLAKGDYFYQRTPALTMNSVYIAGNDKPIEIHTFDLGTTKWTMSKVE